MESTERTIPSRIMNALSRMSSIDDVIIAITKAFLWVILTLVVISTAVLLAKFVKHALIPLIMSI